MKTVVCVDHCIMSSQHRCAARLRELTCDDALRGRRPTLFVLHHLQFDLVLLAWTQTRLLEGGLRPAEGVENLTILLFLPTAKKGKKKKEKKN